MTCSIGTETEILLLYKPSITGIKGMPRIRVNTARTVASSMLPPAIRTYPIDALEAGTMLAAKYPTPICGSPQSGCYKISEQWGYSEDIEQGEQDLLKFLHAFQ